MPLALVFNSVNPILVQGAALADLPMLAGFDEDITAAIPSGRRSRGKSKHRRAHGTEMKRKRQVFRRHDVTGATAESPTSECLNHNQLATQRANRAMSAHQR